MVVAWQGVVVVQLVVEQDMAGRIRFQHVQPTDVRVLVEATEQVQVGRNVEQYKGAARRRQLPQRVLEQVNRTLGVITLGGVAAKRQHGNPFPLTKGDNLPGRTWQVSRRPGGRLIEG
ncbi:hypothetical protein D9M68_831880 [compost metagenome]